MSGKFCFRHGPGFNDKCHSRSFRFVDRQYRLSDGCIYINSTFNCIVLVKTNLKYHKQNNNGNEQLQQRQSYWYYKVIHHHNGDQAAWLPHIMCSNLWSQICYPSIWVLGGWGWARSIAHPWVPTSSHTVDLLPFLSYLAGSKSVSNTRPSRWQIPL